MYHAVSLPKTTVELNFVYTSVVLQKVLVQIATLMMFASCSEALVIPLLLVQSVLPIILKHTLLVSKSTQFMSKW